MIIAILVAVLAVLVSVTAGAAPPVAAADPTAAGSGEVPTTDAGAVTHSTTDPSGGLADNEFLPENANLTDCVGLLERPGCGSEARGGWRQVLVFAILILALVIIFGRVIYAAVKNRNELVSPEEPQR